MLGKKSLVTVEIMAKIILVQFKSIGKCLLALFKYHKTVLMYKLTMKPTVYKITAKEGSERRSGGRVNTEIVRAQVRKFCDCCFY